MSALVVAILAGGLSSRMGQDKRFLKINGVSLLDKAIFLAKQLDGQVLICGAVPGRVCLPDKTAQRGPISGLLSAVHTIQKPVWLLVLPVDMPLLTLDLLKNLFTRAEKPGVAYQNYELPLLFWCDKNAVSILERLERWSVRAFLEALGAKRLSLDTALESCFMNLNCPEDWERLHEYSI